MSLSKAMQMVKMTMIIMMIEYYHVLVSFFFVTMMMNVRYSYYMKYLQQLQFFLLLFESAIDSNRLHNLDFRHTCSKQISSYRFDADIKVVVKIMMMSRLLLFYVFSALKRIMTTLMPIEECMNCVFASSLFVQLMLM